MDHDQILKKLRELMKRTSQAKVNWDGVTDATTIESLGFDSLSILDFIYDIQQEFGMEFEAEEMVTVKTVGELITFLQKKT